MMNGYIMSRQKFLDSFKDSEKEVEELFSDYDIKKLDLVFILHMKAHLSKDNHLWNKAKQSLAKFLAEKQELIDKKKDGNLYNDNQDLQLCNMMKILYEETNQVRVEFTPVG